MWSAAILKLTEKTVRDRRLTDGALAPLSRPAHCETVRQVPEQKAMSSFPASSS